jgi:hypothetical protein
MIDIRCIIAGSRGFTNFDVTCDVLDRVFSKAVERGDGIIIVSGGARGADEMGERYAINKQYALDQYPADWKLYGRSAGYRRNEQMAKDATHLIAFWDGESRGTKHMVDIAVAADLEVRVFDFDGHVRYVHHGSIADTPVVSP